MTISVPVSIAAASANFNSGASSGALTTVAAPSGCLIIVGLGNAASAATITSLVDSNNNTYHTSIQGTADTNMPNGCIAWFINANPIPINTALTATTTTGQWNIDGMWKILGATGGLDKSFTGQSQTGTSLSQATGTLINPNEIIFGQITMAGGVTFSESSGFTNLFGAGPSSNGGIGYQIVSSTTGVTYAPSWGGISEIENWQVATFQDEILYPQQWL
jgi:hypothetical protein